MSDDKIFVEEFENCKRRVRRDVGDPAYKNWLGDLALEKLEEHCLVLSTSSSFKATQVSQRFAAHLVKNWDSAVSPVDRVLVRPRGPAMASQPASKQANQPAGARRNGQSHDTIKNQLGLTGIAPEAASNGSSAAMNVNTVTGSAGAGSARIRANNLAAATPLSEDEEDFLSQLDTPLNETLKFDRFLVGEGNKLAFSAAQNVVSTMTTDNRLVYFYGASGRGKTHLLNAIGHALREKRPEARVFYLTYDNLLNAYVSAVMSRTMMEFRKFLHQIDILLVDDLHLLRGRKATQEELLNLINRMTQEGKTVVVAGGMAPQRLAETGINQRLTDRLAGGTSIPLDKPDLRLRLAILQDMARKAGGDEAIILPDTILELIARRAEASVRELEGAYRFIRLHAQAHGEIPTLDKVRTMLSEHFRHHRREVTLDALKVAVAESFGWSATEMEGRKRPQPLVKARHAYCMLARKLTQESLTAIGASLGRDHTTVISGLRRAEALAETDTGFADKITALLEKFGA
jgi:chromosomal replication initiator protein